MHIVSFCSSFLNDKKKKEEEEGSRRKKKDSSRSKSGLVVEPTAMPWLFKHLHSARAMASSNTSAAANRSSEKKRPSLAFTNPENLPSLDSSYSSFTQAYPRYSETLAIDELRSSEYQHLQETGRVCLDYCGFGLFSQLQQLQNWDSASFALSDISVNLCSHALFGAADEGSIEFDIRKRIMRYLNIQETEYSMVFTESRGASFKLLADVYPFETYSHLTTMYDYESESVGWMAQRAKEKGAKLSSAYFKWPSLRICSTDLKKKLLMRRRKDTVKGLFAFPVQSRVTGAKYSYQWMSLAQQNKWHVLLDASALGPKDMDSLGLSLFRPDFIIASFFKVFGADPSGFGCLFIKNSTMQFIHDSSGAPASGIVTIIPFPQEWLLSESSDGFSEEADQFQYLEEEILPSGVTTKLTSAQAVSSFSGPMLSGKRSIFSDEEKARLHRFEGVIEEFDVDASPTCEENDTMSLQDVAHSPAFSDDGVDNLFCLDVGASPLVTASSLSEHLSGTIHQPLYDAESFTSPANPTESPPSIYRRPSYIAECEQQKGFMEEENMDFSRLSVTCRSKYKLDKEVELLVPGDSPLVANPIENYALGKMGEEKLKIYTFRSPQGEIEPGESSSGTVKGNAKAVSIPNGKLEGVRDKEIAGINLETISEMDKISDFCCNYAHGEETISSASEQIGKGNEVSIPWNKRENAIRRETEGDFRLLGRRNADRCLLPKSLPLRLKDSDSLVPREVKFDNMQGDAYAFQEDEDFSPVPGDEDNDMFSGDDAVEELWAIREPEIFCKSLDHADILGLNKTSFRLRYQINWLITSSLQLRHPGPEKDSPLVHIYGPHVRFDRGASIAFNLYDCHGKLLHPELVQMLAEKNSISLGIGFIKNIRFPNSHSDSFVDMKMNSTTSWKLANSQHNSGRMPSRIEVVTAALGLLSNFEDIYRLWIFLARFLDADFVSKELAHL